MQNLNPPPQKKNPHKTEHIDRIGYTKGSLVVTRGGGGGQLEGEQNG